MSGDQVRSRAIRRLARTAAAALGVAVAIPAGAQVVVRGPDAPVEAGRLVSFTVQSTDGGTIDEVTLDPLALGGPDTFVHRSRQGDAYGPCPHPTTCSIGFTLDVRSAPGPRTVPISVAANGRSLTLTGRFEVSARRTDFDGDGLPDVWEENEGLLTTSGAGDEGVDGDKDGDGVRNYDEYLAGTPPSARFVQFFGDSSPGDRQRMSPCFHFIEPGTVYGWLRLRLLGDDGRQRAVSRFYVSTATGYTCPLPLSQYVADRVLAVEIEMSHPAVVEREMVVSPDTMTFHGGTPVMPSPEWHFAEGPSTRPVDVFLLAYNPQQEPVAATYTYYRSSRDTPVVVERRLPPGRTTVWINADEPSLAGGDFAVAIRAEAPILVDRGLRWHPPGRTAPQESVHAGSPGLSPQWFFPFMDGTRRSDDRLVLANPGGDAASVDIEVFRGNGEPRQFHAQLGSTTRLALRVADFGIDDGVAVRVSTSNGAPIVAEHTQEGRGSPDGRWAFAAPGLTAPAASWALASRDASLVVLNPTEQDALVDIRGTTAADFGPDFELTLDVRAGRLVVVPTDRWGPPTVLSVVVRSRLRNGTGPAPAVIVARTIPRGVPGQAGVRTEAVPATRLP